MLNDDHDDWTDERENSSSAQDLEMQRLLAELDRKAKKAAHYLELEGFIEKTETPDIYKYTPEGYVLVKQQHKKMQENGLL